MLASPLLPSRFTEDNSYRPAKDLEAFNKLLPPPIEFIEGSSSCVLAVAEGKYQPINESPKAAPAVAAASDQSQARLSPTSGQDQDSKKPPPSKTQSTGQDPTSLTKILYSGPIETAWPSNATSGFGLNNTGNTCFLNSALQVLLHTPPLLHILIRHTTLDPCRMKHNCMICALREVTSQASQESRVRSITPYPIIGKLVVIAKHMRRGRQEDSHEFLRYFIDALQRSALAGYPTKVDPKLAEKTWVYAIFGGLLRSRVKCLSCGFNSDTFDRILDLSVDIAGVYSLRDALRKFVAVDQLRGADRYKCEKCKKAVNADKQFTVQEPPLVLTVHLKRFSPMGRKIGHQVLYDERISLSSCMSDARFGPSYSLYGVISHAGGGPNSGHYYAHVRNASGNWYEMNDESTSPHYGPPTNLKNAYILFYIRDRGQVLEAALSAPFSSVPPKTSRIAAMKKRKVVESDDEDQRPSPPKTPKRFIGPLLPSVFPQASETHESGKESPKVDPQADVLAKKIAAVTSPTGKQAQQSLVEYMDDDDDDERGEKVSRAEAEKEDASPANAPNPSPGSASIPSSTSEPTSVPVPTSLSTTADVLSPVARSATASSASTSSKIPSTGIPPSSFYGTPAPSKRKDNKRKSPDGDDGDSSYRTWAKRPLTPPSSGKRSLGAGNPYQRLRGSNNLQERRDSKRPAGRGRGRGFIM